MDQNQITLLLDNTNKKLIYYKWVMIQLLLYYNLVTAEVLAGIAPGLVIYLPERVHMEGIERLLQPGLTGLRAMPFKVVRATIV